jgi:hypothetical protein
LTDNDQQRALIDDELIRTRIRKLADEKPPESRWSRLSKHPLVTLFFGFMLTWTVGTLLTGQINEARRATEVATERARIRNEASADAVANYSRTLSGQEIRAAMFFSALERGARIEEVRERKRAYDDASASWRADLQPTLLAVRQSLGQR